jgi:ABC-2 type transport system permease protein
VTWFGRLVAEANAEQLSFLRRRTAVFFTFGFPLILVLIFGVIVQSSPTGGGLFSRPAGFYVPGYLAVIVLFTPLSRVGSTIARYREGNRFEKLATTPLHRFEWLTAHVIVNVGIILLASGIVLGILTGLTEAAIYPSLLMVPFIITSVVVFCGLGAVIGRLADSQDGVIAASNAVALPLVFLSETFITPTMLPVWFRPAVELSPLTFFARGVRKAIYLQEPAIDELLVLTVLAIGFFILGAYAIPRGE